MTTLVVDGLAVARGGRLLFEGLGFALGPGGALVVTGPNGAGKSSLLRAIGGLIEPASGRIEVDASIAYVAAEPGIKAASTVAAELAFWAALDRAPDGAVARAADAMGVTPLLPYRCGQLSSGQRQRVALARTLASGAGLWLLDEPTAALDAASCARLEAAMAAHRASGGIIVAATHQPLELPGAERLRLG